MLGECLGIVNFSFRHLLSKCQGFPEGVSRAALGLRSCLKVSEAIQKITMMDHMTPRKYIGSIGRIYCYVLALLGDGI